MNHLNRNRKQRGTALVEFAVMLPLLTLLLVGVVDMGLIIHEHQLLQNAAREGAHFSALPANYVDPVNPTATTAAIKQRVIDYLAQENITVNASDITINQGYPIAAGGLTATASQVTVTYTRPLLIGGGSILGFTSVVLTGQSTFRNLY
jgi:Flp pilus assembly protein TadG